VPPTPSSARSYRGQADKSALERALQAFAKSRLGGFLFITVFPAIDRRLLKLSGGRIGSAPRQTVLLHTIGARSGRARTTPVLFTPRGEDLVVIASKAGHAHHPAWYHNLMAHPDIEVQVRGERLRVHAREADGAEREELWRLANDNYIGFDTYQQRAAGRRIPVVVLEPR
jgi:deazaflavin-dependent oxidoreductase (nitroreductase family)